MSKLKYKTFKKMLHNEKKVSNRLSDCLQARSILQSELDLLGKKMQYDRARLREILA